MDIKKKNKKEEGKDDFPLLPDAPRGSDWVAGGLGALLGGAAAGAMGYEAGKSAGYREGMEVGTKLGDRQGYERGFFDARRDDYHRMKSLEEIGAIRKVTMDVGYVHYGHILSSEVPTAVVEMLEEAIKSFITGQKRACCLTSICAMEIALRKRYHEEEEKKGKNKLCKDLLEWARKKNLISEDIKATGHMVRGFSNFYKHKYEELDDLDPALMLSGAIKVINKIYS